MYSQGLVLIKIVITVFGFVWLIFSSSPVQSSYIIELRKLDERVCNIIDFQFLYGYHEPTVVLLYEPLPTWAG